MDIKKSIWRRRLGVVLTNLSLICIVGIFEYSRFYEWTDRIKAIEVVVLIIFFAALIRTYIVPGLWRFFHQKPGELDERELALTNRILRYAYGVFTIVVLVVMMVFALTSTTLDMLLVAALILLAHLLPPSIAAWNKQLM